MIRIFTRVQHEEGISQSRMLLQIHDELLFDVPLGKEQALGCVVREEMTRALSAQLRVELPVVLRVGPNWDELHPDGLNRSRKPGGNSAAQLSFWLEWSYSGMLSPSAFSLCCHLVLLCRFCLGWEGI